MSERFDDLVPPGGWMQAEQRRIEPVSRLKAGLLKSTIPGLVERYGKIQATNLWLTLMHNTRVLRGLLLFGSRLMPFGELERRDTELVILRVAWLTRARYEWGQHVEVGLKVGLQAADIRRVAAGPTAVGWSPRQQSLVQACDDMINAHCIAESTWTALQTHFSDRLMVEVVMLIGWYQGLAGVLNSTGIPLEASVEALLRGKA